ncbi:MAG: complex I NDUFA9 subunit family protein, partial [Pseudomonadota bacterium]
PEAKFAPVYVKDVVEAMARTLDRPQSVGQTYELCGAEVWTLKALVEWVATQRRLKRLVIGLPDVLGRLQGQVFNLVPGKPFSSDNFKSLLTDSVCTEAGFDALGIEPWAMSEKAPQWLNPEDGRQSRYQRFRRSARRD